MTAIQDTTDWRSDAACMSADPDLFFPISTAGPALSQVEQAKAICAGCRAKPACLEFALATEQVHGVWGGTTEEERKRERRRRRPAQATASGQLAARSKRRQTAGGQRQRAR